MGSNSGNRTPALRARDIDRGLTSTALDQAYADGQLSVDEFRARTEAARTAVTLGELHALVADLQLDVELPEPTPRKSGPKISAAVAVVPAVLAVVGVTAALLLRGGDDEPASAVADAAPPAVSMPLPADVTPIVAKPFVFTTAEGLEDFRARYLERFGTSEVVELSLQIDDADRADVYRLNADGRVERVMVNGGFEVMKDTSALREGQQAFDWNLVDATILAGLIAGAPETVGAPDGISDWVRIDNDEGEQRISVSVEVADSGSGRVETDFAGNPTYVSRVDN